MPEINGSHRWIPLGFMNFQPSELAKLITILLIAKSISQPYITGTKIVIRSLTIALLPVALILIEPDLGTALTILISTFAILAVSDLPFVYLLLMISPLISVVTSFSMFLFGFFIIVLIYILNRNNLSKVMIGFSLIINLFFFFITPVIWNSLKGYQQNRILSFLNPMRDPFGAGYQIIQSKIANYIRRKLIDDGIKDTGCPLKVIKTEFAKKIPFFKGMHRFLPALIQLQGGMVKQVEVQHFQRVAGVSKFNMFNRAFKSLVDAFAFRWMRSRYIKYKIVNTNIKK